MPGEVDLHGLYVKEAITYTDQSVAEARARDDREIRLIVGSYKSPFFI
jgi:DNA-nicking Smr family endonuclease